MTLLLVVAGLAAARAFEGGSSPAPIADAPEPVVTEPPAPEQSSEEPAPAEDVTVSSSPTASVQPSTEPATVAPTTPAPGSKPAKPINPGRKVDGNTNINAGATTPARTPEPSQSSDDDDSDKEPGYKPSDPFFEDKDPEDGVGDDGNKPEDPSNDGVSDDDDEPLQGPRPSPSNDTGIKPGPTSSVSQSPSTQPSTTAPQPSTTAPEPSTSTVPSPSTSPSSGSSVSPSITAGPTPGPEVTECNDGIDNDGDGWVDWQYDLGCYGPGDGSETAQARNLEDGWTTFDKPTSGTVYYVSSSTGDDTNDGLTPQTAFATLTKAFQKYRGGQSYNDYVLLKRGDTFTADQTLNWDRYNGISTSQPFLVGTYGDSVERPVIEIAKSKTILGALKHRYWVGIDFYFPQADPSNPQFNVADPVTGGLSMSDNHDNVLLEDIRMRYGMLTVQATSTGHAQNVQIRRSQLAYSWDKKLCKDTPKAQGLYMHNTNNVLIEEVFFLHGGWMEGLPNTLGCANMFNHNLYATSIQDFTVKNSIFLHSASISFKMSAFAEAESHYPDVQWAPYKNVLVENNFFSDSEIGLSAGGNGKLGDRFRNMNIRGNVFSELGSDNSTGRNFHWGLQIYDHHSSVVEGNYFLDSHRYSNSSGIEIGKERPDAVKPDEVLNGTPSNGESQDLLITGNTFYDYAPNAIDLKGGGLHTGVRIENNRFVTGPDVSTSSVNACFVRGVSSSFAGVALNNNEYSSPLSRWFCIDKSTQSMDVWRVHYETTAKVGEFDFIDPERTLTTYALHLGYENEQEIEQAMLDNSRLTWDHRLSGAALTQYIKDGFATK